MSIIFTQFDDGLPVEADRYYHICKYDNNLFDTRLQEIHKLCLFPERLREYIYLVKENERENILNSKTEKGYTPLMIACMNDRIKSVKMLISLVNINIQNIFGDTALLLACNYYDIECLKLLLEYGVDVNIQDNHSVTALYYSIKYCSIKFIKLLLEYGADVNIQNIYGFTSLKYSIRYCKIKIIKLLSQYQTYLHKNTKLETSILTILSNINNSKHNVNLKLTKFDYNSILLFELKKCVF